MFLKIANKVINTELITNMQMHEDGSVTVFFASPGGSSTGQSGFTLRDDEAQKLRDWIEENAKDLQATPAATNVQRMMRQNT